MTLATLLNKLEQVRLNQEIEMDEFAGHYILDCLIEYINNPQVRAKIDEIPF